MVRHEVNELKSQATRVANGYLIMHL